MAPSNDGSKSRPKTILIAGAGIGGPALAVFLANAGHSCTVVERAPDFRASGQQVDVAGEALKVLKYLGVHDACFEHRIQDKGIKFVGANDEVYASFGASSEAGSLVKELEILRPDLARVIYEAATSNERKQKVDFRFDDSISSVTQDNKASGVIVTFASAPDEKQIFDVVVAADGLGSSTRGLAFPENNTRLVTLNMYASYYSIPWTESDGKWSRWHNLPGGRCLSTRPNYARGVTSAYLTQVTPDAGKVAGMPTASEEQRKEIARRFEGAGWEGDRILKGLLGSGGADGEAAKGFYCQEVAQTKSERFVNGRVALLGDAGYCPSPVSGQGSSIALIGAYILAGCIAGADDGGDALEKALLEYERLMRPFADAAQDLPPGIPRIVNPQTGWGIFALNQTLRVAGAVANSDVGGKVGSVLSPLTGLFGKKEKVLPDFPVVHAESC